MRHVRGARDVGVDDRQLGILDEQSRAERRGRVADDAEADQRGARDAGGDGRGVGFARVRGEAEDGAARDTADEADVADERNRFAILARLDDDLAARRGLLQRGRDRLAGSNDESARRSKWMARKRSVRPGSGPGSLTIESASSSVTRTSSATRT